MLLLINYKLLTIYNTIPYQDIQNVFFLNQSEGSQMPSPTAQGFRTLGVGKATFIKILLPAGCFMYFMMCPEGNLPCQALLSLLSPRNWVVLKVTCQAKFTLPVFGKDDIYVQQPVSQHCYRLLRLPCYCFLPNLQRVQQSNSFSRKTKSTLFAGGCKRRMCNFPDTIPWNKKMFILFYSILL